MTAELDRLAKDLAAKAETCQRLMVAIAGPPGSGKSTLATSLLKQLTDLSCDTAILPMDGYHLDNRILTARGLLHRKGAPNTFDGDGFVRMVEHLAECAGAEHVYVPVFDRDRDLAIAGAGVVPQDTKIVLCEGNYLLLKDAPWSRLQPVWDHTIYLDPGMTILEQRLVDRWMDQGLSPEDAGIRARENDLANALLVQKKSAEANLTME